MKLSIMDKWFEVWKEISGVLKHCKFHNQVLGCRCRCGQTIPPRHPQQLSGLGNANQVPRSSPGELCYSKSKKEMVRFKARGQTFSFCISATASGLFGCTFSEVTEGQPFCRHCHQKLLRIETLPSSTSSKYIFFPFPWSMNHWRSLSTRGHELLAFSVRAPLIWTSIRICLLADWSFLREKR